MGLQWFPAPRLLQWLVKQLTFDRAQNDRTLPGGQRAKVALNRLRELDLVRHLPPSVTR